VDLAQLPVKKPTIAVEPAKVVRLTGRMKTLPDDAPWNATGARLPPCPVSDCAETAPDVTIRAAI
jgi:hypothetical protein